MRTSSWLRPLLALGAFSSWAFVSAAAMAAGSWSGGYFGTHGGGVWGNVTVTDTNGGVTPGPFKYSPSGAFAGATAGFNFQNGNFVTGIEGDIGYMGLAGLGMIGSSHATYHQDLMLTGGAYGDLTARFGWTSGQTLLYGKGGVAFFAGRASQTTTFPGYETTPTGTFTGWTAGFGVEKKIADRITVKLEYLHFDFGSRQASQLTINDPPTPAGYIFYNSNALKADSVKVGFNLQLGGP
jgi:outer membrane immunogenic protein